MSNINVEVYNKTIKLLREKPDFADVLRRIVDFEEMFEKTKKYFKDLGWEWWEVRVEPHNIRKLLSRGIVDIVYKSSRHTGYLLVDRLAVKKALEDFSKGKMPEEVLTEEKLEIPKDIFSPIVGHDDVKKLLLMAIKSKEPVHVLLIGEPATAKTLFLMELARLPGSAYVLGSGTTKVGLAEFLIERRPRFLIIDEIDKMNYKDTAVLLSLMETGIVSRVKHNYRISVKLKTWVFGACNSEIVLDRALRSRFLEVKFTKYSPEEFKRVAERVLIVREGVDEKLAKFIAENIVKYTRDVRDAVKVARLANSIEEAEWIIKTFYATDAKT